MWGIWSLASNGRFCSRFSSKRLYVSANYQAKPSQDANLFVFKVLLELGAFVDQSAAMILMAVSSLADRRVVIQAVCAFSSHAGSRFCDLGAAFWADTHFEVFGSKGCLYLCQSHSEHQRVGWAQDQYIPLRFFFFVRVWLIWKANRFNLPISQTFTCIEKLIFQHIEVTWRQFAKGMKAKPSFLFFLSFGLWLLFYLEWKMKDVPFQFDSI